MTLDAWLPLASVLLGGFLTLSSSLIVERYRLRAADRRDQLRRRRSALEELERSAIDAHAKLQATAVLLQALSTDSESVETSPQYDTLAASPAKPARMNTQYLMTAVAEGTGKVEILRAISLAARVGSNEIRKAVSDYASDQLQWSRSPSTGGELLARMETEIRNVLQLVAGELRTIDEANARDLQQGA